MTTNVFRFNGFELDTARFQLRRAGRPVALEPKAFELLRFLVTNRDRLVTRDEILDVLWAGTFVTPNALTRVVAQLRRALGDEAQEARYIETVPRRGYRFIAPVVVDETPHSSPERTPAAGSPASAVLPSSSPPAAASALDAGRGRRRRGPAVAAAAIGVALVALAAGWTAWRAGSGSGHEGETVAGVGSHWTLSEETILTSAETLDADPALSPDGTLLAWASDRSGRFEIYMKPISTDGREVQVTSDGLMNVQPAWSPDGRHIAYHSRVAKGVWVVPATGGPARQLVAQGSNPSWSPDGRRIAFDSYSGAMASATTIWVVDADGGEPTPITAGGTPEGGHVGPVWSPDGRWIAFRSYHLVYTISMIEVATRRIVPIGRGLDVQTLAFTPEGDGVVWSGASESGQARLYLQPIDPGRGEPRGELEELRTTDGKFEGCAIARNGTVAWSTAHSMSTLWTMPVAGDGTAGEPRPLFSSIVRQTFPQFSPDGSRIVYTENRAGQGGQAYLARADGTDPQGLTSGLPPKGFPGWSPDGRRVYFLLGPRLGWIDVATRRTGTAGEFPRRPHYIRLSPDGQQMAYHAEAGGVVNVFVWRPGNATDTQVTFDAEAAAYPVWSPDGRRLAIEVKRGDDVHVAVVPAGGGPIEIVTTTPGLHWPHSWLPDGDRIAMASERDGVWNLYTLSLRTREERQLTRFDEVNGYLRYPAWSPRGDQVVFERSRTHGNIWTARLSRGGRPS